MPRQDRYAESFLEKVEKCRGTPNGKALLAVMRKILSDPIGSGESGILPGVRFCFSGIEQYWIAGLSARMLPAVGGERQEEPCAFCEGPDFVASTAYIFLFLGQDAL